MAELGIDPKELGTYHLAEQRRLVEGQLAASEVTEAAREERRDEGEDRTVDRRASNRRAAERFKQSREQNQPRASSQSTHTRH